MSKARFMNSLENTMVKDRVKKSDIFSQPDVERIKANVPIEMLEYPHWIGFQLKWDAGRNKFNKIPKNPSTGRNAKTDDPDTWGDFEQACNGALKYNFSGVGFVFSDENPFTGIDLDACINDGRISEFALNIVNKMNA